ncbi:MAG TPA: trypsin-like peptidase domain-containing protein, partial [Candidatus Binatia bacterium]|nr:trypsin-like peptidase domain-containing protein [Candidatus Binatia bacterium]
MHRTAVLFLTFCALSIVGFGGLSESRDAFALGEDTVAVATAQEQMLSSTIQIEMIGRGWVDGGLRHRPASRGMGTLVQDGDRRFILTHNHWSLPGAEVDRVELSNAAAELLVVLEGNAFHSLVRYEDRGTLILEAPQSLAGVAPAALGDGSKLMPGDTVWLLSQDAGEGTSLGIASARVQRVDASAIPGLITLRESDAAVVAGDSVGGVWREGRLVGNLSAVFEAPLPPS